jgi:hypothetical protein
MTNGVNQTLGETSPYQFNSHDSISDDMDDCRDFRTSPSGSSRLHNLSNILKHIFLNRSNGSHYIMESDQWSYLILITLNPMVGT